MISEHEKTHLLLCSTAELVYAVDCAQAQLEQMTAPKAGRPPRKPVAPAPAIVELEQRIAFARSVIERRLLG